jgi:hypothetical protein
VLAQLRFRAPLRRARRFFRCRVRCAPRLDQLFLERHKPREELALVGHGGFQSGRGFGCHQLRRRAPGLRRRELGLGALGFLGRGGARRQGSFSGAPGQTCGERSVGRRGRHSRGFDQRRF